MSGQFAALPPESSRLEASRVVLLPAPYDATTTYRGGTRDGPRAIIDASRELELYDLELDCEIAAAGLHTAPEIEPHLGDPAAAISQSSSRSYSSSSREASMIARGPSRVPPR